MTTNDSLGPCPVCGGRLHVAQYRCTDCEVEIAGAFRRCDLCSLPPDQKHFVDVFLEVEGNLRAVERRLGISYPTVKSRLAAVNARLAESRLRAEADIDGTSGADPDVAAAAAVPARSARLALLGDFKAGRLSLEETVALL